MTARLPTPGSDDGDWGQILNSYLLQSHTPDGTLRDDAVTSASLRDGSVGAAQLDTNTRTAVTRASTAVQSVNGKTPDATGAALIQADDIGLENVDNTADADKPVSLATRAALNTKVTTTHGGNEVYYNHGTVGATATIDAAMGNMQQLTLSADCTVSLTGAVDGVVCSLTILITQDTVGAHTITPPASVHWGENAPPVLSTTPGLTDIMTIFTVDGGAKWFGVAGPRGF